MKDLTTERLKALAAEADTHASRPGKVMLNDDEAEKLVAGYVRWLVVTRGMALTTALAYVRQLQSICYFMGEGTYSWDESPPSYRSAAHAMSRYLKEVGP